jgi:hypothetical protein
MEIEGCIDTLVLARSLELPAKLGDVYKKLTGLELINAHDAGADVEAALSLFRTKEFPRAYSNNTVVIGRKTVRIPLMEYIESQKVYCYREKAPPVVPTSARYDSQDQDQGAAELEEGLGVLASDDEEKGEITSLAEFAVRAVVRQRYFNKGYVIAWDNWLNCWFKSEHFLPHFFK